jgi:hypothetical protein
MLPALHVTSLFPNAVVTVTAVGSALDISDYEGNITVVLDAAAGGSGVVIASKVTHCATSGGSYADVTGGGFTTTSANTASKQSITFNADEVEKFLKISFTVTGGTGAGGVAVSVVGVKKYR